MFANNSLIKLAVLRKILWDAYLEVLSLHLISLSSISKLKNKIIKIFKFGPNFRMGPNFLKDRPLVAIVIEHPETYRALP